MEFKRFLKALRETAGSLVLVPFLIGWFYWLYLAYLYESVAMFLTGIIPPMAIGAGLVGLWSLVYEVPDWVIKLFKQSESFF